LREDYAPNWTDIADKAAIQGLDEIGESDRSFIQHSGGLSPAKPMQFKAFHFQIIQKLLQR